MAKIDQARKRGNIKIVWLAWFTDSVAHWEHQDVTPYLMDEPQSSRAPAPDMASSPAPPDAQQISSDPEQQGSTMAEISTFTDPPANTSVVLLNSLVSFYQQESLWVHRTCACPQARPHSINVCTF